VLYLRRRFGGHVLRQGGTIDRILVLVLFGSVHIQWYGMRECRRVRFRSVRSDFDRSDHDNGHAERGELLRDISRLHVLLPVSVGELLSRRLLLRYLHRLSGYV